MQIMLIFEEFSLALWKKVYVLSCRISENYMSGDENNFESEKTEVK